MTKVIALRKSKASNILDDIEIEEKAHCYSMEEIDEYNVYLRNGSATVDPKELILIERGNLWKERLMYFQTL